MSSESTSNGLSSLRNTTAPRKSVEQVGRSPVLDDLLKGAREIGAYAGETEHAIYHIHKTKRPPLAAVIGKVGKDLISTKTKIDRALKTFTT
jgi:hypothetical protein